MTTSDILNGAVYIVFCRDISEGLNNIAFMQYRFFVNVAYIAMVTGHNNHNTFTKV